jgi:pimeloyl-ACP methyl ester carboxylesterase
MNTETSVMSQTTATAQPHYTTGSVTSKDGTTIGYRQLGHSPGVVVLHGAMESADSHMQLAGALADAFTVYAPDRRGRGLSGPFGSDFSLQTAVDDLDALITKTGAGYLFGVSSGGDICLQAALTLPTIQKVAVYEPALIVNGSLSTAFLARYDREIAEGKIAAALVTGMLGAQMGPPMLQRMPRWLLESFTKKAVASEDANPNGSYVSMRTLAPTLHYDFEIVVEASKKLESFRSIGNEVLLLGGSKSPAYLKTALDTLEKVLPHAQRIEFPGLDHGGSSDASATNRGGQPERVAQEMRRFFAER